jgi:creatine kinase
MNEDLAKNQWPAIIETQKADPKHVSLMAKAMSRELFDKLKNHKTAKAGWTIARAINTGVCYPSSFVGCHAADLESYKDYSELFNPVIEAYHDGFKMATSKHITDLDVTKITIDLSPSAKSKIISTRIRVARNLAMYPLNPGGSKESRLQICDLMEKVFATLDSDLKG